MKGFPNQISDLATLADALCVLRDLAAGGRNPRDDGVFGEALIRRAVLRTGYTPVPVEQYLASQKAKKRDSDRRYRTSARGLREFFRVLNPVEDATNEVIVTAAGLQVVALPKAAGRTGRERPFFLARSAGVVRRTP